MIGATLSVENGLLKRWCHGAVGEGCGHYITTREEPWPQRTNCQRFRKPSHIIRRQASISQRETAEWIMHLPHCLSCLSHNNSYLFPAWYDLSREDAARIADLYVDHYPPGIRQPFFYMHSDRLMMVRLETHDTDNDCDGRLDLDTMTVEFNICVQDDRNTTTGTGLAPYEEFLEEDWKYERYRFDLSQPEGWEQMLAAFPQPNRERPAAGSAG